VCAEVLQYYDNHPHERGWRLIAARLRQAHAGVAVICTLKDWLAWHT
jgi:hypothetical protein